MEDFVQSSSAVEDKVIEPATDKEYGSDRSQWALFTPIDKIHNNFLWKYYKVYDREIHPSFDQTVICILCHELYEGDPSCTELTLKKSTQVLENHLKSYHYETYDKERQNRLQNEHSKHYDFFNEYNNDVTLFKLIDLRQQLAPSLLQRNLRRFVETPMVNKNFINIQSSFIINKLGYLYFFLVSTSGETIFPLNLIDSSSLVVTTIERMEYSITFDASKHDNERNDLILLVLFTTNNSEVFSKFAYISNLLENKLNNYHSALSTKPWDSEYLGIIEIRRGCNKAVSEATIVTPVVVEEEEADDDDGENSFIPVQDASDCSIKIKEKQSNSLDNMEDKESTVNFVTPTDNIERGTIENLLHIGTVDNPIIMNDGSDGEEDGDASEISRSRSSSRCLSVVSNGEDGYYWDIQEKDNNLVTKLDKRYEYSATILTKRKRHEYKIGSINELKMLFRSRYCPANSVKDEPCKYKSNCCLTRHYNLPRSLESSQLLRKKSFNDDINIEISFQRINIPISTAIETVSTAMKITDTLCSVEDESEKNNNKFLDALNAESENGHAESEDHPMRRRRFPISRFLNYETETFCYQNTTVSEYDKEFYFGSRLKLRYENEQEEPPEKLVPLFVGNNYDKYLESLVNTANSGVIYYHYQVGQSTTSSSSAKDENEKGFVVEKTNKIHCPWCSFNTGLKDCSFISNGQVCEPVAYEGIQLLLNHLKTSHSRFKFNCTMDQYNNVHIVIVKNHENKPNPFEHHIPYCYCFGDVEVVLAEASVDPVSTPYSTRYTARVQNNTTNSGSNNKNNNSNDVEPQLNIYQDSKYTVYEQYNNPIGFVVKQIAQCDYDYFKEEDIQDDEDQVDNNDEENESSNNHISRPKLLKAQSIRRPPPIKRTTGSDTVSPTEIPNHVLLNGFFNNSVVAEDKIPIYRERKRKRQYYHCQTSAPIHKDELNLHSDDDLDTSFELAKELKCLNEFSDVTKEEKKFMKYWNTHINVYPSYGDRLLPLVCETFIERYWRIIQKKNLRHNLLLHFMNLYDFGLLCQDEIDEYMLQFDSFCDGTCSSMYTSAK